MPTTRTKDRFEIAWPRWRRWLIVAMLMLGVVDAAGVAFFGWGDRARDVAAGTIVSRRLSILVPLITVITLLVWHHRHGIFRGDWSIVTVTAAGVRDRRLSEAIIPWGNVTAIRAWTYPWARSGGPHAVVLELQDAALNRLRLGWTMRVEVGKFRDLGVIGVPIDTLEFSTRVITWKVDPNELLEACRLFHAAAGAPVPSRH